MEIQLQLPVENDDEYLRDDSERIDEFLKSDTRRVLTAAAPRRFGKTSFLKKVERRAGMQGWAAYYVTLDSGIAELSPVFGTNEVNSQTARAWCSALTAPTVLLIDEPNVAVFQGEQQDAEVVRILNTILLHSVRSDSHLKIVFAEVEPFYQKCYDKCESLGERLPLKDLYRLRPVMDARKREWLGNAEKLGDQVGPVPIEVNHLKYSFSEGDISGAETWENYRNLMRPWYNRMVGSMFPEDLDLLHQAATGKIRYSALTECGRTAWRRLSVEGGYGLLKRDTVGNISVTSAELKAHLPRMSDIAAHEPVIIGQPSIEVLDSVLTAFDQGFMIHQIADMHFGHFRNYVDHSKSHAAECYIQYLWGMPVARRPHVIVVCGDLTSTGSVSELDEAYTFLKKLTQNFQGPLLCPLIPGLKVDYKRQILVVPGNHDVLDSGPDGGADAVQKVIADDFLTSFSDPPAIHYGPAALTIALLNSAEETRGLHDLMEMDLPEGEQREGFLNIRNLLNDTYGKVRELLDEIDVNSKSLEDRKAILKEKIRFTAGYVRHESLNAPGRNVERAERNAASAFPVKKNPPRPPVPETIRIGVCHHNISISSEATLFTDLVNGAEVREYFQSNGLNVVLHGHQHRGLLTTEDRHGKAPRLHTIGTGALGACDAEPYFNEIVVDCSSPTPDKPNLRTMTIQPYYMREINALNPRWCTDEVKTTIEVAVHKKVVNA